MIGSYIQRLRADAGVSRSLLARQAGISRITLWRWERGDTLPRDIELQATLEALKATDQQRRQALVFYTNKAPETVELACVRQGRTLLHRGDILVALRGRRGWTQEEAATRVDVPRVTLARWENMNTWPPPDRLDRLCDAYRVNARELCALTFYYSQEAAATDADLDTLRARIASWSQAIHQLDELDCLAVAGRLDRLAQEQPVARGILCSTLLCYAHYLIHCYRLNEAAHYLRLARSLLNEADPVAAVVHRRLEASALRLRYRNDKRLTRARCGELSYLRLRPLTDTMTDLPAAVQATILGDLAISLTLMRRYVEADQMNARTCQLAQTVDTPLRLQCLLQRHWLLSEAGRHAEALAIEPEPTGVAFVDAYFMVLQGKALLGAGSLEKGQQQLQQALRLGLAHGWTAISVGAQELLQHLPLTL